MADNELARILARRRAKDGSTEASPASPSLTTPPAAPSPSDSTSSETSGVGSGRINAPSAGLGMSIAERIALMKKSAENSPANSPVSVVTESHSHVQSSPPSAGAQVHITPPPPPVAPVIRPQTYNPYQASSSVSPGHSSHTPNSSSTPIQTPSPVAPAASTPSYESEASNTPQASPDVTAFSSPSMPANESSPSATAEPVVGRKVGSGIHERLARLGAVNVNAFKPGAGGPPPRRAHTSSSGEISEPSPTSEEKEERTSYSYGAVAMPGMARAGFALPGMAKPSPKSSEDEGGDVSPAVTAPAPEISHSTLTRATGPAKRRPAAKKAPTSVPAAVPAVEGASASSINQTPDLASTASGNFSPLFEPPADTSVTSQTSVKVPSPRNVSVASPISPSSSGHPVSNTTSSFSALSLQQKPSSAQNTESDDEDDWGDGSSSAPAVAAKAVTAPSGSSPPPLFGSPVSESFRPDTSSQLPPRPASSSSVGSGFSLSRVPPPPPPRNALGRRDTPASIPDVSPPTSHHHHHHSPTQPPLSSIPGGETGALSPTSIKAAAGASASRYAPPPRQQSRQDDSDDEDDDGGLFG